MLVLGSCAFWSLGVLPATAAEDEILTVVFSMAHNGYVRTKLPDGTFKPETYAFGEGGYASGLMRDDSIDHFPFTKLAGILAPYLARQNYVPTQSPEGTDLLVMVHWGTTIPYGGYQTALDDLQAASRPSAEGGPMGDTTSAFMMLNLHNWLRDKANAHNAALLGYLPEINRIGSAQPFLGLAPRTTYYSDLVSDLEEDRYYVILAAYDFRLAWKQKQLKLLWVTRVSIRAHGNRFDQQLETMVASASRYFGEDSRFLIRRRVPEGKVKIGEPKVIEVVPDASK